MTSTPTKSQSLQDPFLNALRRERIPTVIHLVNGLKVEGTIESFDPQCVLLRGSTTPLVYKHAIAYIEPVHGVKVGPGGGYIQYDPPAADAA